MEFDLMELPSRMVILLVLWTVSLLTYRVLKALIEAKKTVDPLARLLHDDDARTECIHKTGEYFMRSAGPCSCTGVLSGVVTKISESDKFRLFHKAPGYSHLEDDLHVRLTGVKIAQTQGEDTHETIRFQTVVKVGDATSSVKTSILDHPGEAPFLSNGGNPLNDNYFDERMVGFNAFNKTHILEDSKIGTPNQNDPNKRLSVEDTPSDSGQPISVIYAIKPTVVPCNGVNVPIYGKLNRKYDQELSSFEILNKKKIMSSPQNPHLLSTVCNASNISQTVKELPNIICNTEPAQNNRSAITNDVQNQTPSTPDLAVSLPTVQSPVPDYSAVSAPCVGYPLFDPILCEAENRTLMEDSNPMLGDLANISGQPTACSFIGTMSNVPHDAAPHIDLCQQVRTSKADDPMQRHDDKATDQLEKFLRGSAFSIPTVFGPDPEIMSILTGSNGRALPKACPRNVQWEQPWIENSLQTQIISSECTQSETNNLEDDTGFSETTMTPFGDLNYSEDACFNEVLSSDPVSNREHVVTAMNSKESSSGNAVLELNSSHILDDWKFTSDYEAVNTLSPATTIVSASLRPLPAPQPSPHVQNTSCGGAGTVTVAADGRQPTGGGESLESIPAMLPTVTSSSGTVELNVESSSRTSNADDNDFTCEEMSYTRGPSMLTTFSLNNRAIDCDKEAFRSIIISRRKSAMSSGSSIWSTSEDDPTPIFSTTSSP